MPNKFRQKTFKFTCHDCGFSQTIFAVENSSCIYDFKCSKCGAGYSYNFINNKTTFDFQKSSQNFKQNYWWKNLANAAKNTNQSWWNNLINPPNKLTVEGYYTYEIDSTVLKLDLRDSFDFRKELMSHGIRCDINTKRWNDEINGKIYFLQLPVDFIPSYYETMKVVTKNNYIGIYLNWCLKNDCAPLKFDVLAQLFENLETDAEYALILDLIMTMNLKNSSDILDAMRNKLKLRLELFNRIPSGTNMMLAYSLMEELTLKKFEQNLINVNEKQIERFDKLKNLALDTKFIEERKLAFNKSLEIFKKISQVEI